MKLVFLLFLLEQITLKSDAKLEYRRLWLCKPNCYIYLWRKPTARPAYSFEDLSKIQIQVTILRASLRLIIISFIPYRPVLRNRPTAIVWEYRSYAIRTKSLDLSSISWSAVSVADALSTRTIDPNLLSSILISVMLFR